MRMTYILSESLPPGSLFDTKQKAKEIFNSDLPKKKKKSVKLTKSVKIHNFEFTYLE